LDLALVAPNSNPPVAKILDYGKYKYEQAKAEQKAKKLGKAHELKEVRFSPKIGAHDLEIKVNRVREFLSEGHKVKIVMVFKGREMMFRKDGEEKLRNIASSLSDISEIEGPATFMHRQFSLLLVPRKKAN